MYAPTRDVLEVVSLLRLPIDDDTYRFDDDPERFFAFLLDPKRRR